MTDRREPDPDAPGPERLALPGAVGPPARAGRRLSTPAAIALIVGAGLALWPASLAFESARAWLARQEAHSVRFRDIEVEPDPPPALLGGKAGLLERVLKRSGHPDPIRLLDQDLNALGDAFRLHSPWVAKVLRVERRPPHRLIVRLEYRDPVARIEYRASPDIALDAGTHVLPGEDMEPKALAALVRIQGFREPAGRPGQVLETADSARNPDRIDPDALAAVGLASLLQSSGMGKRLRVETIAISPRNGKKYLFFLTADHLWVLWGPLPPEGPANAVGPSEKLRRLQAWDFASAESVKARGSDMYLDLRPPKGPKIRPGG